VTWPSLLPFLLLPSRLAPMSLIFSPQSMVLYCYGAGLSPPMGLPGP
jgi:hypothetical protein